MPCIYYFYYIIYKIYTCCNIFFFLFSFFLDRNLEIGSILFLNFKVLIFSSTKTKHINFAIFRRRFRYQLTRHSSVYRYSPDWRESFSGAPKASQICQGRFPVWPFKTIWRSTPHGRSWIAHTVATETPGFGDSKAAFDVSPTRTDSAAIQRD